MDLLTRAGKEYGWDLKLDTIASLWRAGCIIRAELLGDIMAAYAGEAPANMLLAPAFKNLMEELVPSWRRVVAKATALGIPRAGVRFRTVLLRRPAPRPPARIPDSGSA